MKATKVSEIEFWNTVEAYRSKSEFDNTPVDCLYLTDDPSEFDDFNVNEWNQPEGYQEYPDAIPF